MYEPPIPENEEQRLVSLQSYGILDSPREQAYDDITRLVSYVCETPVSTITLIDRNRQWFKVPVELESVPVQETERKPSFCASAMLRPTVTIIPDTLKDERYRDNPFVVAAPGIRFYAGAPITSLDGYALGTLCTFDMKPRSLKLQQIEALQILARQVMALLELRKLRAAALPKA